jgi:hypothetical protein
MNHPICRYRSVRRDLLVAVCCAFLVLGGVRSAAVMIQPASYSAPVEEEIKHEAAAPRSARPTSRKAEQPHRPAAAPALAAFSPIALLSAHLRAAPANHSARPIAAGAFLRC